MFQNCSRIIKYSHTNNWICFSMKSRESVSIVEFHRLFFASDAILRNITCSTRLMQISLVYYGNIPYNLAYF